MLPTGQHIAAWRHPDVPAAMHTDLAAYASLARQAEQAFFDLFFIADNDGVQAGAWTRDALSRTANRHAAQFEPLTLLSALAATTSHIGLVATASTTYFDPYRLARQFASLDLLSGGRAGWNMVTSHDASIAANYGLDAALDHAARYARAEEFIEVVAGLWNSWEDDAFIRDKASGRFFDPAKLHTLNHKGAHFSVAGPLNVARSPQGRPVVIQAGSSEPGRDLAARTAEVVFTAQNSFEGAKAFSDDVKGRLARYGRAPADLLVMPGLCAIAAATEAEARDRFEELQSLIDPVVGLAHLQTLIGVDLSGHPLDGPVPELPATNGMKSRQQLFLDLARRDGLTLRQLMQQAAGAKGHWLLVGTGSQIAEKIAQWFEGGAADGFNIMPADTPGGFESFVKHVLPHLQERGLVRERYEGNTLRGHLGLPTLQANVQ